MSVAKKLQELRGQILADFNSSDPISVSGAFGATGFSALTEISVSLLLMLRRQSGKTEGYESFRKIFLELLGETDRGAAIDRLFPALAPLVKARFLAQFANLAHLPAAFAWKIYTAQEAAALPADMLLKEVYRRVLNREIEPAALASWGDMLRRGAKLQDVIHAIESSEEAASVQSGQHILVIDALPAEIEAMIVSLRHLQEVELQRLYDFARLLALFDPLGAQE